ncbi:DUF2284 domain-containing protein [Clostridium diolis]|uniref:DUF2284 domain-containing protein n=1 Tax=Clostridium diolis TaxID=223919 RepID=UPI003AF4E905
MLNISFLTKTPSKEIIITGKLAKTLTNNLLKYEYKDKFSQLCKDGCPNFGNKWACPPFSPSFSSYSKNYPYSYLVLLSCNISEFNYIKQEYMKLKASNSILKSRSEKIMRSLENHFNGVMLSNGSCRLCKPCSCKKKLTSCNRPNLMRFSLESLGLDVSKISIDLLNHELLWYKNKRSPEYSTVVSCLLTKDLISEVDLVTFIKKTCSEI